jgi:membrane-associated protease RseP (regulator of RpoE activity)
MGVLAVTAIPLAEELFYRGLVHGAVRRYNVALALVVQAALFAAMHQYDLTYALFVFAGGLVFGLIYEWRRTLITPIAAHFTGNTVSVVLVGLAISAHHARPTLGVMLADEPGGARVTLVMPGSAADAAGIEPGDLIVALDGQSMSASKDVVDAVRQCEVGDEIVLTVQRGDALETLRATLRRRR